MRFDGARKAPGSNTVASRIDMLIAATDGRFSSATNNTDCKTSGTCSRPLEVRRSDGLILSTPKILRKILPGIDFASGHTRFR